MFDFLKPYTWFLYLLGALAVVIIPTYLFFAVTDHYEKVGFERAKAQWEAERAGIIHEHRLKEWVWMGKYQQAEHENETLKQQNRLSAAAARDANRRLLNAGSEIAAGLVRGSVETCAITAATAIELLGECSERYISVGEAADGHAADARLFNDSWPQPEVTNQHQ